MTAVKQGDRIDPVPNQPKTPVRGFRLDDETIWEPLVREAEARGIPTSDVVREALLEHIERRESGEGTAR
jgi:hypothetical protein